MLVQEGMVMTRDFAPTKPAVVQPLAAERGQVLDPRLAVYALGAAGVVGLAAPANASIVYTKVNAAISSGILPIDLDQDGKQDFALHNYFVGTPSSVQRSPSRGTLPIRRRRSSATKQASFRTRR